MSNHLPWRMASIASCNLRALDKEAFRSFSGARLLSLDACIFDTGLYARWTVSACWRFPDGFACLRGDHRRGLVRNPDLKSLLVLRRLALLRICARAVRAKSLLMPRPGSAFSLEPSVGAFLTAAAPLSSSPPGQTLAGRPGIKCSGVVNQYEQATGVFMHSCKQVVTTNRKPIKAD
jgi:hypothetical protein